MFSKIDYVHIHQIAEKGIRSAHPTQKCKPMLFFKVFINDKMIFLLKTGSHFVGGYWLDFSPTGPETKTFILQAFSTR